jgi:hypothetical protein
LTQTFSFPRIVYDHLSQEQSTAVLGKLQGLQRIFTFIHSFDPWNRHDPKFTVKETVTRRGLVTWAESPDQERADLELKSRDWQAASYGMKRLEIWVLEKRSSSSRRHLGKAIRLT